MMRYDIESISDKVKTMIDEKRFIHSMGVAMTAKSLAGIYHIDEEKAYLCGILHDCAKNVPGEEMIELCEERGIFVNDVERKNTSLLHGKVGSIFVKEKFGINDPEIESAISCHTVGKPNMSLLDKIICISDYIEPNRGNLPRIEEIREVVKTDIDNAILIYIESTISHCKSKGTLIDPTSFLTYEFYKKAGNMMENESLKMVKLAVDALADKKAEDIKVIDISEISDIADYFVIAGGLNPSQIQALSDNVEESLSRAGYPSKQKEGYESANWVLIDFADIIVHIFDKENRLLYNIERLWRDGKEVKLDVF